MSLQHDTVAISIKPVVSTLDQRDALLSAIEYALPPGKRVKALTITRTPEGGLEGELVREAAV